MEYGGRSVCCVALRRGHVGLVTPCPAMMWRVSCYQRIAVQHEPRGRKDAPVREAFRQSATCAMRRRECGGSGSQLDGKLAVPMPDYS